MEADEAVKEFMPVAAVVTAWLSRWAASLLWRRRMLIVRPEEVEDRVTKEAAGLDGRVEGEGDEEAMEVER